MLEIIITSSLLILIILALRFLLRGKLSPIVIYALWAIVAIRLLVPVSVADTSISVMNLFERQEDTMQSESITAAVPGGNQYMPPVQNTDNIYTEESGANISEPAPDIHKTDYNTAPAEPQNSISLQNVLMIIWGIGSVFVLAYTIISNVRFYLRLKENRRQISVSDSQLPVYVSDCIDSPCLFGIIHPAVYINEFTADDLQRAKYIITHELTHYRHLDHIWAVVRVLCLSMHWFNPLVWLAAHLSKQDCELACDSTAIRTLGDEHRYDYGRTLIDMINTKFQLSTAMMTSTAMTSDAKSIRRRIEMLRIPHKNMLWAVTAVVCILMIAVGCTFTGAAADDILSSSDVTSESDAAEVDSAKAYPSDLPIQITYFIIEQHSDGILDVENMWTVTDMTYVMSILDESNLTAVAPQDIPADSWIIAGLSADYSVSYSITNDGYVICHDMSGLASSAELITIETGNVASGQYYDGHYGFYKLPEGKLDELLGRLQAIEQEHQNVDSRGVGIISKELTDYVTAMIYDGYSPESRTPAGIYTFDDSSEYQMLRAFHSNEWRTIDVSDIPEDTELALTLAINNFEYFHISADGYVIWNYLGEEANNAEQIAVDTIHEHFPVSSVYPEGYYGFYKMPAGTAETVIYYANKAADVQQANTDPEYASLQKLAVELIQSGTCRMDYLDVYIMLDNEKKIDDVLSYIAAYDIANLKAFDSSKLPEDNLVYESCVFSQTDLSSHTESVRVMISISQYAAWMTVFNGESITELEMVNNSAMDGLMHHFVRENIAGDSVYVFHNGNFDSLFCSDIAVDSDDYNYNSSAFAYGGDIFSNIWALFADIHEWEKIEAPDESALDNSRKVSIKSIAPYNPPDCQMILYADAGYVSLTFKGSTEWYYVPAGLEARCDDIADIVTMR